MTNSLPITDQRAEEEFKFDYHSLLLEYLEEDTGYPSPYKKRLLSDANHAKGECDKISKDLRDWLNKRGIPSVMAPLDGFQMKLDEGAAKDWMEFVGDDPSRTRHFWHAVVFTGDAYLDLTGSQYGYKYAGIRVCTPEAMCKEWKKGANPGPSLDHDAPTHRRRAKQP